MSKFTKLLKNTRAGLLVLLCLLAALAATFAFSPPAHAQAGEDDYVDVAVTLEVPDQHSRVTRQNLDIIVLNNGSRTAYDVEVVVDVKSPDMSYYAIINTITLVYADVPVGTSSAENDERTFRWSIPALGPLRRESVRVHVIHRDLDPDPNSRQWDDSSIPHEYFGEVTTSSFERGIHKGNNTSRVWSYRYDEPNERYRQAAGNYTVAVSVDDPSPSPGDTVNFTITADRTKPTDYSGTDVPPIDTKVDIELTGGLTAAGTPTYRCADLDTCTPPAQLSYSDGVFDIGTLKARKSTRNSVTLPVLVASDAVVNEQCLTATISGNPPPGTGPRDDDLSDNVAKVCLGDQPAEPFVTGEVEIFTVYDCFARQTYPCDGTDGVRVRAVNKNVGSGIIMSPGTTIVQVQESVAGVYDDYVRNTVQQSVTDANTVSWQTATDAHANFTGTRKGVKIFFSRIPFNGQLNNWVKVAGEHVTAEGLDGGNPPGDMYIRSSTGSAFTKMNSGNSWTVTYSGTSLKTDQSSPMSWFAEFSKLGTYVVDYTTVGNRDDTNGDCASELLPSGVAAAYCDTETYTFHVGPMADLAVEDGGASSFVATGQHALTIVAVNNGPDTPLDAQVTGLPTGAEVLFKFPDSSTYDSTTGEWDIGELKVRGYYRSAGTSEPTLVLSASAGDTASVSIANSETTRYASALRIIRVTWPIPRKPTARP